VIRVEIDLNVRVRGNWTFVGLEDADGQVTVGDLVQVFEPESELEGPGRIEEVDFERRLIFLSVDWASLEPPGSSPLRVDEVAAYGIIASLSSRPAMAVATSSPQSTLVQVVDAPAVACAA